MKDETQPSINNGNLSLPHLSSSRFSSLLATKDRDFLLSPTGAQVLLSLTCSFLQPANNPNVHR